LANFLMALMAGQANLMAGKRYRLVFAEFFVEKI
jgi:hypothetical protein